MDSFLLGYSAEHYVYEGMEGGDSVLEEEWRTRN